MMSVLKHDLCMLIVVSSFTEASWLSRMRLCIWLWLLAKLTTCRL